VRHALIVLLLLAVSACSNATPTEDTESAAGAETEQTEPPKPVPAELPDVIATINGETLSKAEFEAAVKEVEQRAGSAVPADQRDRVYRDVLEQMISYRLIAQEAASRKIDVSEQEVDSRLAVFKAHFGSEDDFNKALAAQALTLETFRDQTRSEMQMTKLLETEVDSKIDIQPQDVTAFYESNPDQFKEPERVRASHILIMVPPDGDTSAKDTARSKAQDVLKRIRAGGDFAALAKEHSEDPSNAGQGGDLGYFSRGQMVEPFEKAAFSIQPGELSDVVETPFGFHVIKVADRQEGRTLPLDEVRAQLEEFLRNRERQERTSAFVDTLKKKGQVDVGI